LKKLTLLSEGSGGQEYRKKQGGLGVRDMEMINKSLIIHATWKVANNNNPFLSAILKAKYHPNDSFWKAPNTGSRSIFWSSIMQVKDLLDNNSIRFMQGILPFGHRLGSLVGNKFMTISSLQ
jgi:hypothetical protein